MAANLTQSTIIALVAGLISFYAATQVQEEKINYLEGRIVRIVDRAEGNQKEARRNLDKEIDKLDAKFHMLIKDIYLVQVPERKH